MKTIGMKTSKTMAAGILSLMMTATAAPAQEFEETNARTALLGNRISGTWWMSFPGGNH